MVAFRLVLVLVLSGLVRASEGDELEFHSDEIPSVAFMDMDEDYIDHDCKNIKKFTQENLDKETWYVKGRKFRTSKKEPAFKYNHAYGIPVIGVERFTDQAMLRACYLIRFLFADNEHLRRIARQRQTYAVGQNGGYCCPAQMGNQGLTCSCKVNNNNFPMLGIGAPAHEMAHWFLGHLMPLITKPGMFALPEFVNKTAWSWKKPYNMPEYAKCKNVEGLSKKYGSFFDFLWNSQWQDKKLGTTKIAECKWQHYFIYTGQQNYLHFSGGGSLKEAAREKLVTNNTNLYNLNALMWPCNNYYIAVCKDAAFDFTAGLYQKLKIGKADKTNPSKMRCNKKIDNREVPKKGKKAISHPTADVFEDATKAKSKAKCLKVLQRRGWLKKGQTEKDLKEGEVEKALREDSEYDWYLRRCCHSTAKFSGQ